MHAQVLASSNAVRACTSRPHETRAVRPAARPGRARVLAASAAVALSADAAEAPAEAPATTGAVLKGPARMFQASVDCMLDRFWAAGPRALSAVERLYTSPGGFGTDQMAFDHVAFRTFGVPGLGIDGVEAALASFGFTRQGEFEIPERKLTAAWFAPPPLVPGGPPAYGELPSVFASQIEVDRLSPRAQSIITRRTSAVPALGPSAAWAAALTRALPWGHDPPSWQEYAELMAESEYASWVLVNGYAPAHMALACHCARTAVAAGGGALAAFTTRLQSRGFALNEAPWPPSRSGNGAAGADGRGSDGSGSGGSNGGGSGGGAVVHASEDGLLLQAATVADLGEFWFAGEHEPFLVPGSYLALVERRPLPEFARLPPAELRPAHLHQGFDAAACSALFASTQLAAEAAAAEAAAQAAASEAAEHAA